MWFACVLVFFGGVAFGVAIVLWGGIGSEDELQRIQADQAEEEKRNAEAGFAEILSEDVVKRERDLVNWKEGRR